MSEKTPLAQAERKTDLAEIVDLARAFEPDRLFAATLAHDPQQQALIALAAYSADLLRIVSTVTDPMIGEIRLQWWRDGIERLALGEKTGSPIADAVGAAICDFKLPADMVAAVSDARTWDLYGDEMPDNSVLDAYFVKTEAILFELAMRVAGVAAGLALDLSLPAGRAYGRCRLLARLPHLLAAGRMPVPLAALSAPEGSSDALAAKQRTEALKNWIGIMTREALSEMEIARRLMAPLSRQQRVAVLPLSVVPPYLKAINNRNSDPLRDIVGLAPLHRVWRIGAGYLLGSI